MLRAIIFEGPASIARRGPLGVVLGAIIVAFLARPSDSSAAGLSVTLRNSVVISSGTGLSGVTYLGGGEFAVVQDNSDQLFRFDVTFATDGSIASVGTITSLTLADSLDFEGIAFTNAIRSSVFISEESNPGVREYNLTTGSLLQTVAIPSVFTTVGNMVSNRGFESLARDSTGTVMWTASEEALTVDGPLATSSTGTTVRLQRFSVAGNAVTAAEQYAYEVDPIHTAGSPSQSGLVDLVVLPDGTLLGLERSAASTLFPPVFVNRIYEIDLAGATDINSGSLASGLLSETFTPVGKTELWSGSIAGTLGSGENLEGLALGPQLANGDWILLGVVDDGDALSNNRLVSFTLTVPEPSAVMLFFIGGTVILGRVRSRDRRGR